MSSPNQRQSLTKNLETRYGQQKAGGAFDVKEVLKSPNVSPAAGTVFDAKSSNAQQFKSPNGFEFKLPTMETRFKDAQGTKSKQLSSYVRNLDTTRYH